MYLVLFKLSKKGLLSNKSLLLACKNKFSRSRQELIVVPIKDNKCLIFIRKSGRSNNLSNGRCISMFHSKILQLLTKDLPQLEVTEELTVIDTVNTALARARARHANVIRNRSAINSDFDLSSTLFNLKILIHTFILKLGLGSYL